MKTFLMLTGSLVLLCCTTPATSLESFFVPDYLEGTPLSQSILRLWKQTEENRTNYLDKLASEPGFNGLYFRGEGRQSLDSDRHEYRYGIDLELFDNGRHESRRLQARNTVESRIRYLQLLDDMSRRAADEQRHNLHLVQRRVDREWLEEKVALLKHQLDKARKALASGLLRKDEFGDYVLRHTEAELRLEALRSNEPVAMPKRWRKLLNQAENLRTLSESELNERALRQDHGLRLQQLFIERTRFHPEWKDNLEARLFVEKRHNDFNDIDDLVVGFRTRVPLDRPRGRDALIEIESRSYREQAEAIRMRIEERIARQLGLFHRHQAILRGKLVRLKAMDERREQLRRHASLVVASLPYTPEKALEVLARERLDLLHDILLERLQILEYMINLAEVTRDSDLSTLLFAAGQGTADGP